MLDTYDTLAVGEDVSTVSSTDAQHWIEFYRELSSFDQTVRRLKRKLEKYSGDCRRTASRLLLPDLIAECEGYSRRFDFWQGRLAVLT